MLPLVTMLSAVAVVAALAAAATAGLKVTERRLAPASRDRWLPRLLLAPALALILLWIALPTVQTLWLSLVADGRLAVVDHLGWLLGSGGRTAVANTIGWAIIVPVGSVAIALGLAHLADRLRAERLVVSVIVAPAMVSLVAVAVTWRLLLAFRPAETDQVGPINQIVTTVGLSPVAWLVQPPANTVLLAGALIWATTGLCLLVLLGAVRRVPEDLRDAARVDGATEAQVFTRVTVPTIKGSMAVAAAATAIVSIRAFDLVQVATGGEHGSEVLSTAMVHEGLVGAHAGRGAALATFMALIILPVALVLLRRARRAEAHR